MSQYGILDPGILFSHFTNPTIEDSELLLKSESYVSSTPSTEMQMGFGKPVAFDPDHNTQSNCSLGADCHSNNSASIISEMRLLLQSSRSAYDQRFVDKGLVPKTMYKTVEEAFNLGTINGAKAIGMEDKIGSLAVGKLADIVVFDGLSPSMICGAQHDPLAAVVIHSSPGDIELVVIDGVVRKSGTALKPVYTTAGKEIWADKEAADLGDLSWKDIARNLVERRKGIQKKFDKLDLEEARSGAIKAFYIDESKISDKLE